MIELIGGGARSGKSSYALEKVKLVGGNNVFVATATADDSGMANRIKRHQKERDNSWTLIEEPLYLSRVVSQHKRGDVLLIDCLTLWLSNWLCAERVDRWTKEKCALINALESTQADVFLVTNEVGLGVVPMGQLSRDFVDQSGWLHQDLAKMADTVTMVTFGIPQKIK